MRTVKTALFFATLSGYVMVYGKVAKMEKTISIDNVIRALVAPPAWQARIRILLLNWHQCPIKN